MQAIDRRGVPSGIASPVQAILLLALIAFIHVLTDNAASARTSGRMTPPEPVSELRNDGLVLYVRHVANRKVVTEVWSKPEDVARVFRPDGQGGYCHLGRIPPVEWPATADVR